jgi:hypothetical protein
MSEVAAPPGQMIVAEVRPLGLTQPMIGRWKYLPDNNNDRGRVSVVLRKGDPPNDTQLDHLQHWP